MSDCAEIQAQMSEFVDGLLPSQRHAAVLAHVRTCEACRSALADLERIVNTARQLGPIAPPDHIWLEVAGQVRLGAQPAAPAAPTPPPRRRALWQWVGLSAALLAITAGIYEFQRRPAPAPSPAPPPAASIQGVNDELTLAMQHYERAVAELEAVAREDNSQLDPSVVATLRTNLGVADAAIAESRAALTSNPESDPARDSLFEALRRKISVLQATVALINEMRQGDPAGAAAAAERAGRQS
jgi:anti-sigma factor RsiW